MENSVTNTSETEDTTKETQKPPTPEQLKEWEEAEKTPLELNTNPNPKQVEAWKIKYDKLKKIVVSDDEDAKELIFYFKPLELDELRLANAELKKGDYTEYARVIIVNCAINGRSVILKTDVFLAIMPMLEKIITSKTAAFSKK